MRRLVLVLLAGVLGLGAGVALAALTVTVDAGTEDWSSQAARTVLRSSSAVRGSAPPPAPTTTYAMYVDGQLVEESTATSVPYTFGDGDHLLEVAARQGSDPYGPRTGRRVRVDTVAPRLSAWSVPGSAVAGQPTFAHARGADTGSGVASTVWRANGQEISTNPDGPLVFPTTGAVDLAVTFTDGAGNQSTSRWPVQVTAPAAPPAWSSLPTGGTAPVPRPPSTTTTRKPTVRVPRLRARAEYDGRWITVSGSVSGADGGTITLRLTAPRTRAATATAELDRGSFTARLRASGAGPFRLVATLAPAGGLPAPAALDVDVRDRRPRPEHGHPLCANVRSGEQCGPGNGRRTAGGPGTGNVSHAGWPAVTGVLWKVLDSGNHHRRGGADNDELLGHHGNDRLDGAGGADILWGDWDPVGNTTRQFDRLSGGPGNDWIYPSHGKNVVRGGSGADHIKAFYGHGTIDCGPGKDFIQVRMNGAYRYRNCEKVNHFCAHGSRPDGTCKKPTARGRRTAGF